MNAVLAPVNPHMLIWARVESGLDQKSVSERFGLKDPERLEAWETGRQKPTLRQAEKLATIYKRPLGIFFLPQPPPTTTLAAEYRRLPGVKPGNESPALRLALRQLRRHREIALELFEENSAPIPYLQLKAQLVNDPERIGHALREALDLSTADQKAWKTDYEAWRTWRDKVESIGILVVQLSGLPLEEVRGVALLTEPLPVIGVNSKDAPNSRPFTLFHEVMHLMLRKGGDESSAADDRHTREEWQQIERFADSASAATLIPRDALLSETLVRRHSNGPKWDTDNVSVLARKFWVTPLAMMTRLVSLGLTTWQF